MKETRVLAIGRDRTALVVGSQLQGRLALYDKQVAMVHVVMGKGSAKSIVIGRSVVIAPGGRTLPTAFLRALVAAVAAAKREPITAITTQDVLYAGLVGYVVARLFRLPLLVQLHGDYLDNPAWYGSRVGYGNRLMNGVGKWVLHRADKVRAVSARLAAQLTTQFGIPTERIISIPIGTDLSLFGQVASNQVRSRRLLFVGRLIPEKEPLLFCRVAAAVCVADATVTVGVAGEGFLQSEMAAVFAEAGLTDRVTFYGALTQAELAPLYAASYAYIHTAGWEGWGMPMIESIAAGCPVVTTDSGCAGEAIRHDDTGLVVPVNDEAGLVRETTRLLADRVLWERLVAAGRIESARWSLQGLTATLVSWYEQV